MSLPRSACLASIALFLVIAAGCGGKTSSPTSIPRGADTLGSTLPATEGPGGGSAAGWGDFYPLALGNRWRYEFTLTSELIPFEGLPIRDGEGWFIDREISCERVVGDATYRVETTREEFGDQPLPPSEWVSYRQDRSGLYEQYVSINDPACPLAQPSVAASTDREPAALSAFDRGWRRAFSGARRIADDPGLDQAVAALRRKVSLLIRAPGTGPEATAVLPAELTRLRYPLHVGQTWTINPDIGYRARVVAARPLDLPAGRFNAYEIQYGDGFLGANDDVRFWYSDQGALAMAAHLEGVWTDDAGNIRGTVVTEFRSRLVERTLNR